MASKIETTPKQPRPAKAPAKPAATRSWKLTTVRQLTSGGCCCGGCCCGGASS